jgi:PrtD family type I secretion system ABC transporter
MLASAAALLLLGLALLNHRLTRQPIEALQREAGDAQRYLDLAMQNAEAAEAMGMGPALVHRWQELSGKVAALQRPTARLTVSMSTLTRVLRQLVQVLLQAAGAYLVIKAESTPGVLVASTMLLGRALAPIEQIVGSWRVLSEGLLAWRRLAPVMAQAAQQPAAMALPRPNGALLAQGLSYRAGDRFLLAGVSLMLRPGEAMAVIGPSGAGKSTLIRLLIGLWAPSAGTVRLDGVEVSKWPRDQLGPHIGYLPQDVELFAGTVAENIARLGGVNADMVVAAAKLAGVHELILSLTHGYDTRIDPHAALLSPGQRQRIGLARAVYGDPRLVVLDEPNANLDQKGNEALGATLAALKGKATVVMVTHRHEALAQADKMIVIEDGRATAFGSPAEVDQFLRQRAQAQARPQQIAANGPTRPPALANGPSPARGPGSTGGPAAPQRDAPSGGPPVRPSAPTSTGAARPAPTTVHPIRSTSRSAR